MSAELKTQWGVQLHEQSSQQDSGVTTVIVEDRPAALTYHQTHGGRIVHRRVGPWVEWTKEEEPNGDPAGRLVR